MEFYDNQTIRVNDLVQVAQDARSGLDGAYCKVRRVDNMTAMATVEHVNRGGRRDIHVSKLTIIGRLKIEQLKLEFNL